MNSEVRAYVRRQWRWYAAAAWAQVATSIGFSVYLFLRYGLHSSDALEALLLPNAFFVAFSYFIVDHNEDKPHAWTLSAAKFAPASWFVMFTGGGIAVTSTSEDLSPIALPCLGLAVVCVAAIVVAGRAKGRVMDEVGLVEMMEADIGARFEVRDNKAVFTVDSNKVMLMWTVEKWRTFDDRTETWQTRESVNGSDRTSVGCSLGNIKKLRTTYIRRPRTVPMPGNSRKLFKLSVGPALVFDSPDGEWIVSINRAQDAFDAIKGKRGRFRKSAPGHHLGSFLPKNL
jgi:hypothetical protein